MTPQELIERALASPPGSPDRGLLVAAALRAEAGVDVVLIGGAAVNAFVEAYRPTDIDLAGPEAVRAALTSLGFRREGRHHVLEAGERTLAVEIPTAWPDGENDPIEVEIEAGVIALLISLEDLVMDRLWQATDMTSVTRDDALRLFVGAYERIDWGEIARRVDAAENSGQLGSERLAPLFSDLRRKAKRLLRNEPLR